MRHLIDHPKTLHGSAVGANFRLGCVLAKTLGQSGNGVVTNTVRLLRELAKEGKA